MGEAAEAGESSAIQRHLDLPTLHLTTTAETYPCFSRHKNGRALQTCGTNLKTKIKPRAGNRLPQHPNKTQCGGAFRKWQPERRCSGYNHEDTAKGSSPRQSVTKRTFPSLTLLYWNNLTSFVWMPEIFTAINLFCYILQPSDSFWKLILYLLLQEKWFLQTFTQYYPLRCTLVLLVYFCSGGV